MTQDATRRGILYWTSQTCRSLRQLSGASRTAVADQAGITLAALARFERGENMPRDLEAVVAAYAAVVGTGPPQVLWFDALEAWARSEGHRGLRDKALTPLESDVQRGDTDVLLLEVINLLARVVKEVEEIRPNFRQAIIADASEVIRRSMAGEQISVVAINGNGNGNA